MSGAPHSPATAAGLTGRYAIFHAGRECGEERWRIEPASDGAIATGVQESWAPHPIPNRQDYRIVLDDRARPRQIEIRWTVGERELLATHAADGATWRVRIEYAGHVKEQEGDFPDYCEVETTSHLSSTFMLARRDFRVGGEHEYPVLRIGPPYMAVQPDRMLVRCEAEGEVLIGVRPVRAKRYVASLVGGGGEPMRHAFWADERGIVIESYEGTDPAAPWMRLVEYGGA